MPFLQKVESLLVAAMLFICAGIAGSPFKSAALSGERSVSADAVKAARGAGALWGLLGGYRSLISDFAWIKGYVDCERKDISGCVSAIELATTIDPYMTIFWTQGAAIIAFDTPHWMLQKLPPAQRTEAALRIFKSRQAAAAIKFLDKALALFPNNGEILLQKGQIAISEGDFKLAEECYAPLASLPEPTVYARRIYASLLVKNGKFGKAVEVLESVLRDTEPDSPIKKLIADQIEKTKALLKKTN